MNQNNFNYNNTTKSHYLADSSGPQKPHSCSVSKSHHRCPRLVLLAVLMLVMGLFVSCEKAFMSPDLSASAVNTFDYLWNKVDQQYSMFDVKDVDWNAVYDSIRPKVHNGMKSDSLFNVCAGMLDLLRDGHVNLVGPYDVSRSSDVYHGFYSESGIDRNTVFLYYLGPGYHVSGGMTHNALADGKVIYILYSSFSNGVSDAQLRNLHKLYPDAQGMIFDIRGNGGGALSNVYELLKLFRSHGQQIYSSQIKNGPGHNDFSPLQPTFAPKADTTTCFNLPVYVLTDRGCFSAASTFAIATQAYDHVHLLGDTTGGGMGLPAMGVLPNGWNYRFSITRTLALDGRNYENGVPPDIPVKFNPDLAFHSHRDNIIDTAVQLILSDQASL